MTSTERRFHLVTAHAMLTRAAEIATAAVVTSSGDDPIQPNPIIERLIKGAAEHERLAMRVPEKQIAEITERHRMVEKDGPTMADLDIAHQDRAVLLKLAVGEWIPAHLES